MLNARETMIFQAGAASGFLAWEALRHLYRRSIRWRCKECGFFVISKSPEYRYSIGVMHMHDKHSGV